MHAGANSGASDIYNTTDLCLVYWQPACLTGALPGEVHTWMSGSVYTNVLTCACGYVQLITSPLGVHMCGQMWYGIILCFVEAVREQRGRGEP